jgi:mevalonate kinase
MDNEVKKEGNVQEVEETQANLAESEKVLERFLEVLSEMNQQTVEMLQTGDLSTLYDMNDTVEEFCRIQMGNKENFYQGIQVEAQIIYENFDKMVNLANRVKQGKWTKNQSATVYDCLQNILAANITILKRYGLIK